MTYRFYNEKDCEKVKKLCDEYKLGFPERNKYLNDKCKI